MKIRALFSLLIALSLLGADVPALRAVMACAGTPAEATPARGACCCAPGACSNDVAGAEGLKSRCCEVQTTDRNVERTAPAPAPVNPEASGALPPAPAPAGIECTASPAAPVPARETRNPSESPPRYDLYCAYLI